MPEFKSSVTVNAPLEKAFDFLVRPANTLRLSPPDLGLRFTQAPEVCVVGSRLEFQVQNWGQIHRMVHEVTVVEAPNLLVEKQLQGPFKLWLHERRIESIGAGQSQVTDVIQFEPPGGLLGLLLPAKKILDYLDDGFYYRHQQLQKLLSEEP